MKFLIILTVAIFAFAAVQSAPTPEEEAKAGEAAPAATDVKPALVADAPAAPDAAAPARAGDDTTAKAAEAQAPEQKPAK